MSYSKFNTEDIVLSSDTVSVPIWSTGTETLSGPAGLATSSAQVLGLSGNYYLDVYNKNSNGQPGTVQFAIAYADINGSGSTNYSSEPTTDGYSPSRTNYGQYRSLVLGDEESEFYFGGSTVVTSSCFWAISVDRARYRESLQPGALDLTLKSGSKTLTLVDGGFYNETVVYKDSGRVYNVYDKAVGSNGDVYGYYLPDIGTILLDCERVGSGSANTITASRYTASLDGAGRVTDNTYLHNDLVLYNAISSFTLKEQETVTSNYIFVRAKNSEFNYSINPSNITSTGELKHSVMINQPETYITSVGLYNDANELLAVAKLSRPLAKSFSKEALIRIKLDY